AAVRGLDQAASGLEDAETTLNNVTFGGGQWVVVGDFGSLLTSPDGFAWTLQTLPTAGSLQDVAFVNGQFVAVGFNGTILTSPDARTWQRQTSGTDSALRGTDFA